MLKKKFGLVLGLVVLTGSACVTPTHASSAPQVIITRIQASGEYGAKDEYVVLHNNSGVEVDITNWCLVNKYGVQFACFNSSPTQDDGVAHYYLPAYAAASIASQEHANSSGLLTEYYTLVYDVTNQSSGSIVNGSDTLSLVTNEGEVVDTKSWASAIPTGKALSRMRIMMGPDIYAATGAVSDWLIETRSVPPQNAAQVRIIFDDVDLPPDPGLETPNEEEPLDITLLQDLMITELLANPAGSDTGKEYIEIYNPNELNAVSLDSYKLHIGTSSVKIYSFPAGASIPPLGYRAFSNQDIGYTLVNTSGKVQIVREGENVGVAVEYESPKDDYSWAYIEGAWQYTKQATPGAANNIAVIIEDDAKANTSAKDTPKQCASNQYRNPETGRCKLIATASSTPTPCKANQQRNPETNRCRNIVAASTPTPCKEGQERNPETNRCRNIVKMSRANYGVKGIQSKADTVMAWYYWVAIGVIILLILSYAIWEWRQELSVLWSRVYAKFAKQAD